MFNIWSAVENESSNEVVASLILQQPGRCCPDLTTSQVVAEVIITLKTIEERGAWQSGTYTEKQSKEKIER